MNTLRFQLQFMQSNLRNPALNFPRTVPVKPKSNPQTPPSLLNPNITRNSHHNDRTQELKIISLKSKILSRNEFPAVIPEGHSRFIAIGAVSLGLAILVMGFDDHKAFALGPEGPLVEEFWDNMRRYGLYALTVSTGALYALVEPFVELLKNPISAILILALLGGGFFIVSQVVSAMVGLTDFSYDYSY